MNYIDKEINFEQILAGAILKFGVVDAIDLKLIIADLKSRGFTKIDELYRTFNLGRFIKQIDNKYIFNDELAFNSILYSEGLTVKEKIRQVIGQTLLSYYANLDADEFKRRKEIFLNINGNKLLNNGRVLLISDNKEDYKQLVQYGFKNIDYFSSIVRANNYFVKNADKINQYHLILLGNQAVKSDYIQHFEIEKTLQKLKYDNEILVAPIKKCQLNNRTYLETFLHNNSSMQSYYINSNTYKELFNQIFTCALVNEVLEKRTISNKFEQIPDYENPNKIALSSDLSKLNIFYLDAGRQDNLPSKLSDRLGLKINANVSNSYDDPNFIQTNLGNYDIMIASSLYNQNILEFNHESTEQCKDTGRLLTLFVSYKTNQDSSSFIIEYSFGGKYAPDYEKHTISINMTNNDYSNKYTQRFIVNHNLVMERIVKESVNIYNRALKLLNPVEFDTKDMVSIVKDEVVTSANKYDKLFNKVMLFLKYRDEELITEKPVDINIIDGLNSIKIIDSHYGVINAVLTLPKVQYQDDVRLFGLQTFLDGGVLDVMRISGAYSKNTSLLDENNFNKANKQDLELLNRIEKKLDIILSKVRQSSYQSRQRKKRQ